MSSCEIYKTTFYSCSCGYKSIHAGNASWHKKKNTDHTMSTQSKEFVLKEDYDNIAAVSIKSGDHGTSLHPNNGNLTVQNIQFHLKKYRNEYLVDSSYVLDDTYHLQYLPPGAQVPLKDQWDGRRFIF